MARSRHFTEAVVALDQTHPTQANTYPTLLKSLLDGELPFGGLSAARLAAPLAVGWQARALLQEDARSILGGVLSAEHHKRLEVLGRALLFSPGNVEDVPRLSALAGKLRTRDALLWLDAQLSRTTRKANTVLDPRTMAASRFRIPIPAVLTPQDRKVLETAAREYCEAFARAGNGQGSVAVEGNTTGIASLVVRLGHPQRSVQLPAETPVDDFSDDELPPDLRPEVLAARTERHRPRPTPSSQDDGNASEGGWEGRFVLHSPSGRRTSEDGGWGRFIRAQYGIRD